MGKNKPSIIAEIIKALNERSNPVTIPEIIKALERNRIILDYVTHMDVFVRTEEVSKIKEKEINRLIVEIKELTNRLWKLLE